MTDNTASRPTAAQKLPDMRVGDDVHATIERDSAGNAVLVLIAPLEHASTTDDPEHG